MVSDDSEAIRIHTDRLFLDWIRPATAERGPWLVACVTEPGPIAPQARWQCLRTLGDHPGLRELHRISREQWQA